MDGLDTTRSPAPGASPTFRRVASFVFGTAADDIPAPILDQAALLLLDTLGVCAASTPMEAGQSARHVAGLLFGSGTPDHTARMMFDGRPASLAGAIYAAATQTDNLDAHDGYNPTKGHIGVVAVPALAILAEALPDLDGREALTALVIGYEVAGRAGIALHASVSDYHTSGAWNALGVAAMAARLRRQSPAQLREALGIAEYHGPRSQMMREIATPTMLHDGAGWGGLAGMSAAILAEQGFTGAPAITVEAPDAARHWEDLGKLWQVGLQYIKPYPICRWAHAAIDAAAELVARHDLRPTEIAGIRIRSFENAVALFAGMPSTTSEAQYSLAFAVAARIVHGRIGLAQISDGGLSDPVVAGMVDRISLSPDPRHEGRYPAERWADVEITTTDGRVLVSGDVHARGGPERPYSHDDIVEKFREYAIPVLGEARATALQEAVLALPNRDTRFADVARQVFDPV